MKIICHFGAHKTATSHLQYNLKLNRQLLERNGIKYFRFHEIKELQHQVILLRVNTHNKHFDIKFATAAIKKIIENEIKGYDCGIISYEGILGPIEQHKFSDIYPDAKDVINIYKDILKCHEVIPVFASRNYDSFLRSTYKWKIKKSSTYYPITLNEYLANKGLSPNRWTQIVEALQNAFDGNVRYFAYEDYKANWKRVMYEIVKLTGKPINYNQLMFDSQKKNVSGSQASLDFYYTLHLLFDKLPDFKRKKRLYKSMRYRLQPFSKTRLGSELLFHHQKGEIPPLNDFDDYWNEVAQLKETYGILKE